MKPFLPGNLFFEDPCLIVICYIMLVSKPGARPFDDIVENFTPLSFCVDVTHVL